MLPPNLFISGSFFRQINGYFGCAMGLLDAAHNKQFSYAWNLIKIKFSMA